MLKSIKLKGADMDSFIEGLMIVSGLALLSASQPTHS